MSFEQIRLLRSAKPSAHGLALADWGDTVACCWGALLRWVAGQSCPTAQAIVTRGAAEEAEVHYPVVAIARRSVILPVAVRYDRLGSRPKSCTPV
jgi:hypothetical protein